MWLHPEVSVATVDSPHLIKRPDLHSRLPSEYLQVLDHDLKNVRLYENWWEKMSGNRCLAREQRANTTVWIQIWKRSALTVNEFALELKGKGFDQTNTYIHKYQSHAAVMYRTGWKGEQSWIVECGTRQIIIQIISKAYSLLRIQSKKMQMQSNSSADVM